MYVDSCVLTKLFIREPDSAQCAALLANSFIVSSEMAQTELASALLRKEREGNLSRTQRELAWADFERQIQDESIRLVRLDGPVVRHATALMIRVHPQVPLRTLDASVETFITSADNLFAASSNEILVLVDGS